MSAEVKKFEIKYVHYLIVIACVIGGQFMPQTGPITPVGWGVLGTFIGVIWGWTFIDMIWPSIIGLVGLCYAVDTTSVMAASFGNPVLPMIILAFSMMVILTETNLTEVIVRLFVSNRFAKGRPWMFVFFFLLGGFVCSQINSFVCMIMMSGILINLCAKVGIKPFTPFPAIMLTGLALVVQTGAIMVPFRGSGITLVAAYSSVVGEMPNFLMYMAFCIPLGLFLVILYTLVCKFVFRIDVSALKEMPEDIFGAKQKMTRDQKTALFFLFFLVVMLLSTSIMPETWALSIALKKITMFGQAAIVILVLMMTKKEDGSRMFNFSACAAKGVSWDALFMTAFILPISGFMTDSSTGIGAALSMLLQPLTKLSPILFIIVAMVFAGLITNVANNIVLAIVILPVIVIFAGEMGLPPLGIACILFIVVQLALITPGASAFAGMAFAQSEWVAPKVMMKYALIAVIIMLPIFLLVAIPYSLILF